MNISTHIQDLLYRYECVVLPGFGAFLSQKQSAYIDENSKEFFPPNKVISFNRQLIKNDGLLANYIADVESVKYNSANNMIQEFVYDLENSLQNEAKAELANIGKFYLDRKTNFNLNLLARSIFLLNLLDWILIKHFLFNVKFTRNRLKNLKKKLRYYSLRKEEDLLS